MMYLANALLTLHMFVGIFLIGLILLQRGRGGGLAGSFGGMGGQSAFGTKAGDIFTRITIAVAVIWILLACVCILVVSAATKGRATFVGKVPVAKAAADDNAAEKDQSPLNNKVPEDGAGDGTEVVPPTPGKAEQPKGDEKKPEAKQDDGAADAKKPADAEAKPAEASPDAPADAKEKDKEKPENSATKKPE